MLWECRKEQMSYMKERNVILFGGAGLNMNDFLGRIPP